MLLEREPNMDAFCDRALAAHQAPADRAEDEFDRWVRGLPEFTRDLLETFDKHTDFDLWACFWQAREAGRL